MKLKWKHYGEGQHGDSRIDIGSLHISVAQSIRENYKDGTAWYMIYLSVPGADSKEIITLKKVRGYRSDAIKAAEEWIETHLMQPLSELEFELSAQARIAKAEARAVELGAEYCYIEDVDDEHKEDSFWYGGIIAELSYKGYCILVKSVGEVRVSVYRDEEHYDCILDYVDKNNEGALMDSEAMAAFKNDEHLRELDNNGLLYWSNNNWLEFFFYNENDVDITNEVVGGFMCNIYEGNVIDAITDVDYYTSVIDEYINERDGGITIERYEGQRISLTSAEVEYIYRERELRYRIEDARKQVYEFFGEEAIEADSEEEKIAKEKYGIYPITLLCEKRLRTLAERFIDSCDCNIDENTLWHDVIETYINEGR